MAAPSVGASPYHHQSRPHTHSPKQRARPTASSPTSGFSGEGAGDLVVRPVAAMVVILAATAERPAVRPVPALGSVGGMGGTHFLSV